MEIINLTTDQLNELLAAKDHEMYSLLGAAAIASTDPIELLNAGRSGNFYQPAPAVLGPEIPFEHQGLERAARAFLRTWGAQLRKAICDNQILSEEERTRGRREVEVILATVVASITSQIP